MGATDTIKHSDVGNSDREESKTMLRNIRYINRKESVMCVFHVEEEDQESYDDQATVTTETDSDSETSSVKNSKDVHEAPPKRKSVRFMFEETEISDLCPETSSIVSEPVRSPVKHFYGKENYKDDSNLPQLKKEPTTKGRSDKYRTSWPGKKNPDAVPKHMFQTLNTLGLSPRITRKMSIQTLSDIRTAINESREKVKKGKHLSKSLNKLPNQRRQRVVENVHSQLNVIPESESLPSTPKPFPRKLAPVYPKLPTYSSQFVASEAEADKLEFIKKALSPMPDIQSESDYPRTRAATISGGEKRSWILHRRNSREDVGEWINPILKKFGQANKDDKKEVELKNNWFSDLPKTEDSCDFSRL